MAKHKPSEKKTKHLSNKKQAETEPEYPEKVEKIFKRLLRVLSWIVGTSFVLIVLLPEFNSPILDKITRYIYLIGISCLLIFIVIEFFTTSIKNLIARIVHA